MEVAVRVQDPSGTVTRDVILEGHGANTVTELVEVLVDVMEWPRETLSGEPLTYRVRRIGEPDPLDGDLEVASLGIQQGDGLVLGLADPE